MPRSARAPKPIVVRACAVALGAFLAVIPAASPGPAAPVSAGLEGGPTVETFDGIPLVGEFFVEGTQIDDVVVLWDEILDPRFDPDPADFTVTINAQPWDPSDATILFSGLASESFIFGPDGVTFMQLDLPPGVTYDSSDDVQLRYEPTTIPVRDLALNASTGFTDAQVIGLDIGSFNPLVSVLDSYHGSNKVVVALTEPVVPASLPAPSQFTVVVDTTTAAPVTAPVLSVADLSPGVGMALIELTLADQVTDPASIITVDYTAQPGKLISAFRGLELESQLGMQVQVFLAIDSATAELEAGEPISTAGPEGPTPADPVATTIVPAAGGTVTITETTVEADPSSGYEFFGNQIAITMPDAPSPAQPNVITFDVDASTMPSGQDETSIQIFRNGVVVADCQGAPGVADPTPCISERAASTGGDITITVLTVQASTWNVGLVLPMNFGGFLSPVNSDVPNVARAGRAIPVKFSLDGDRGLGIFEAGSPSVRSLSCVGLEDGDIIEETVTAGSSNLTYHPESDTYTYVWKTSSAWAQTCRRLVLAFADGTMATAIFDFRR